MSLFYQASGNYNLVKRGRQTEADVKRRNREHIWGHIYFELPVRHPSGKMDLAVWGLEERSGLEIELWESSEQVKSQDSMG